LSSRIAAWHAVTEPPALDVIRSKIDPVADGIELVPASGSFFRQPDETWSWTDCAGRHIDWQDLFDMAGLAEHVAEQYQREHMRCSTFPEDKAVDNIFLSIALNCHCEQRSV
jgi:hypothetical protein